jgi:hypothetical protein
MGNVSLLEVLEVLQLLGESGEPRRVPDRIVECIACRAILQ